MNRAPRLSGPSMLALVLGSALLGGIGAACSEDPPKPISEPSATQAATGSQAPVASAAPPASAPASAAATNDPAPSADPSAPAAASATAAPAPTSVASAKPTASSAPTTTTPPPQPEPLPTAVNLPAPVPGSADEVAAKIDSVFSDQTRFSARFVQKHKQKVAGVEREQKGIVYVERPNKISFRYDPPNKNRIVSDGTTLRVYVAEDEQMFENPVKNTEYPGAFSFIMGEGVRKSFSFTFNEKVKFDPGPVIFGKPRSPQPGYESVQFYIDKTKLAAESQSAVVGGLVLEAQGNRNRFEPSDAKFPEKIDAGEFAFTPPPGTNIVK